MEKIKGRIASASSLQITEKAPYLDAVSKEILSNREFLEIISKYIIQEYADISTTMDIYAELSDKKKKESFRLLDAECNDMCQYVI